MIKVKTILFFFFCILQISNCSQEEQKKIKADKEPLFTANPTYSGFDATFDSEIWKKSNFKERARFTNDILRNERLLHLSKGEVINLLGKPDSVFRQENVYQYNIDISGSLNDGTPILHYLYIKFDNKEICFSVRIVD